MKTATGTTLISNGQLVDGTGAAPIPNGAVVIENGRITFVGPLAQAPKTLPDAKKIDARGGTILPGLVEAHFHATYFNVEQLEDLDIKYPVEYVSLLASVNAKLALECGYTAARSGGCLFNCDVWLKTAIENDLVPGPRLSSSGREICSAGGLMDWNPEFRRIGMDGLVFCINGVEDARKAVRALVKDGVEWVKTYPTGDAASPDVNDHHTLCMTFEEMNAVVQTAHNHKLKVTGHCRATQGIINALRAGYDSVEHATFIDNEGLDLLLQRDVPVCPGLRFELASIERGPEFKLPQRVIDGHQETLEGGAESCRKILKAGGRLGMGGDYGFGWNPHGDYAKELTFFVNYVGFTPLQTLTCATKTGAEIMGRANEIGTLEPGKLGDILVVEGDVVKNIALLEDRRNILAVLQGGIVKAGRMNQPGGIMSFIERHTTGKLKLRYIDSAPSAPFNRRKSPAALLMLHGVTRRAEDFQPLFAGLLPHARIMALDQRGHGDSQRASSYYVTDYAADAIAFLRDDLAAPVIIYGHSLGAMVAASVAAQLPDHVAGIILEDPPFHTMGRDIHTTHWQSQFAAMRDIARRGGSVDHITGSLADIPVPRPDGTSKRLGDLRDRASLQWSARCLASIDPEILTPIIAGHWLDGYDIPGTFARIKCPTLLLQADPAAGGAMTDADIRLACELIAHCKVERFDGCGHLLHWLQPARIAGLAAEFLES